MIPGLLLGKDVLTNFEAVDVDDKDILEDDVDDDDYHDDEEEDDALDFAMDYINGLDVAKEPIVEEAFIVDTSTKR